MFLISILFPSGTETFTDVPFGSAYFFNWARAVFFVKKADESDAEDEMNVGIFHKKANEAALSSSRGFLFRFLDESVTVSHKQLTDTAEFVQQLTFTVLAGLPAGDYTLEVRATIHGSEDVRTGEAACCLERDAVLKCKEEVNYAANL